MMQWTSIRGGVASLAAEAAMLLEAVYFSRYLIDGPRVLTRETMRRTIGRGT